MSSDDEGCGCVILGIFIIYCIVHCCTYGIPFTEKPQPAQPAQTNSAEMQAHILKYHTETTSINLSKMAEIADEMPPVMLPCVNSTFIALNAANLSSYAAKTYIKSEQKESLEMQAHILKYHTNTPSKKEQK